MAVLRLGIGDREKNDDRDQELRSLQVAGDRRIERIAHDHFGADEQHDADDDHGRGIGQVVLDLGEQGAGLGGQDGQKGPGHHDHDDDVEKLKHSRAVARVLGVGPFLPDLAGAGGDFRPGLRRDLHHFQPFMEDRNPFLVGGTVGRDHGGNGIRLRRRHGVAHGLRGLLPGLHVNALEAHEAAHGQTLGDVFGHFVELVGAERVRIGEAEAVYGAAIERVVAVGRGDHRRHGAEGLQRLGVEARNAHLDALHVRDRLDPLVAHELIGRQERRAEELHAPAIRQLGLDVRVAHHGHFHLGPLLQRDRQQERQLHDRQQGKLVGVVADANLTGFDGADLDVFRVLLAMAEGIAVADLELEGAGCGRLQLGLEGFDACREGALAAPDIEVPDALLRGARAADRGRKAHGGETERDCRRQKFPQMTFHCDCLAVTRPILNRIFRMTPPRHRKR